MGSIALSRASTARDQRRGSAGTRDSRVLGERPSHRVLRWLGSSHLARSLCRFRSLFAESGARLFGQVRDRMFFLCSGRCFLDVFSGSRSLFFTGHVLSLFESV